MPFRVAALSPYLTFVAVTGLDRYIRVTLCAAPRAVRSTIKRSRTLSIMTTITTTINKFSNDKASIARTPGGILAARPVVMGGAGFSYQLHLKSETLPIRELISRAFQLGITAIYTSPYYEPSEQLMGAAINSPEIKQKWPRESYILMTKVGRIAVDKFDYPPRVGQGICAAISRTFPDLVPGRCVLP